MIAVVVFRRGSSRVISTCLPPDLSIWSLRPSQADLAESLIDPSLETPQAIFYAPGKSPMLSYQGWYFKF